MKLLAIDLDDTLLRDDNTVSDYTKEVLKKAQDKGIEVLIATGRMYQTAYPVAHRLGLGDVPMVLYSGGVIQRVESKELIWERAIPPEVAHKVLAIAKEHNIYIQSYIDDELLVHSETEFSRLYEEITQEIKETNKQIKECNAKGEKVIIDTTEVDNINCKKKHG